MALSFIYLTLYAHCALHNLHNFFKDQNTRTWLKSFDSEYHEHVIFIKLTKENGHWTIQDDNTLIYCNIIADHLVGRKTTIVRICAQHLRLKLLYRRWTLGTCL